MMKRTATKIDGLYQTRSVNAWLVVDLTQGIIHDNWIHLGHLNAGTGTSLRFPCTFTHRVDPLVYMENP